MDGIERITAKIASDAQAEIDALTAQAQAQAEEVLAAGRARAEARAEELAEKGRRAAAEREERMASVAQLDARNVTLKAKQELLDRAFDRALEKLCAQEGDAYVELLAGLLVNASHTGREQVAFAAKDRAAGEAAVLKANEKLAKTGAKGAANLTVAEESRDIQGGFILIDGRVETNCAFETLVRLEKTNMAGEVAGLLFA